MLVIQVFTIKERIRKVGKSLMAISEMRRTFFAAPALLARLAAENILWEARQRRVQRRSGIPERNFPEPTSIDINQET